MKNEDSNTGTNLLFLLTGGGIGAILALLFAPKTGQELRSDIAGATRAGLDRTEATARQLRDKAQDVYGETATKAGELYDTARQKIGSAATAISEIPGDLQSAARDKIEEIISPIEAGKTDSILENGVLNPHEPAKAVI